MPVVIWFTTQSQPWRKSSLEFLLAPVGRSVTVQQHHVHDISSLPFTLLAQQLTLRQVVSDILQTNQGGSQVTAVQSSFCPEGRHQRQWPREVA